jgi:type II secretory pathway component PulJ
LELILALGVTCMLAVAVFASLHIGMQARDSVMRGIAPVRQVQVSLDIMAKDFQGAMMPHGIDNPEGLMAQEFYGEPVGSSRDSTDLDGSVMFYAMTPPSSVIVGDPAPAAPDMTMGASAPSDDPVLEEGVHRIEWGLAKQSDGSTALVRRIWHNLLPVFEDAQADVEEVICPNVTDYSITYSVDGVNWEDGWDSTAEADSLPLAVHVMLKVKGTETVFERTIALPMASVNASGSADG